MEKLLEQAQELVTSLRNAIRHYNDKEAILIKEQAANDSIKVTLDNFQSELLERESKVTPIENIEETRLKVNELKTNADLEWSKIRAEWNDIDTRKKSDQAEIASAREGVKGQKELYERGARENVKAKDVLEKKLKAIQQAGV